MTVRRAVRAPAPPDGRCIAGVVARAGAAALALLVTSAAWSTATPAGADTGTAGAGSGGGTVSVGAGSGSGPGGSGGGSTGGSPSGGGGPSPWECTYTVLDLNDEGGFPAGGAQPGAWYSVTCDDPATGAQVTQTVWITGAPPAPGPAVDPHALALQAERSMTLPAPRLLLDPAGSSVVGLATWLWVDPVLWHPLSVTATAGGVSATAVARPVAVTWTTGDGGAEDCSGPGIAYDPTVPSGWQTSYCTHTYLRSSLGQPSPDGDPDDGRYPVTATVTWAVSWTAVGAPGGGALPTLTTSSATSLRVVQVESVEAVPGSTAAAPRSWLGGGS